MEFKGMLYKKDYFVVLRGGYQRHQRSIPQVAPKQINKLFLQTIVPQAPHTTG